MVKVGFRVDAKKDFASTKNIPNSKAKIVLANTNQI